MAPLDLALENTVTVPDPSKMGHWSIPIELENVAIHVHLLPTGKILYWGRRKEFGSAVFATLNDHACQTYIWDPADGTSRETENQPTLKDGTTVNLFLLRPHVPGGRTIDGRGRAPVRQPGG